jgi:riboflavin synthase
VFTGIIEATAGVLEKSSSQLILDRPKGFTDVKRGSSISVSGVCLTVVKLTKESMAFDVVPETWKRTTLGTLVAKGRARRGEAPKGRSRVNLERALLISRVIPSRVELVEARIEGRFEGHIVLGHVDDVGTVEHVTLSGVSAEADTKTKRPATLTNSYTSYHRGLLVEKGSIAVDGVSLTIASLNDETFSVALIPHTLAETTLGGLKEGDTVNLEADILGKYRTNS